MFWFPTSSSSSSSSSQSELCNAFEWHEKESEFHRNNFHVKRFLYTVHKTSVRIRLKCEKRSIDPYKIFPPKKRCKPIAIRFSFWHERKVFDLILVSKFEKRFAKIARVCCISHSNWANIRRVEFHSIHDRRVAIFVMNSNT